MKSLIFSSMLLIGLGATAGRAQESCDAVLAHGPFDIEINGSKEGVESRFLNWMCSNHFSTIQEMTDAGGSVTLPIVDLPISVSARLRSGKFSEFRDEACSVSNGTFKHARELSDFSAKASAILVGAWTTCMNHNGTFASFKMGASPESFAIFIQRNSDKVNDDGYTITSIAADPADAITCIPALDSFVNQREVGATPTIVCHRKDISKAITIAPTVALLKFPLPLLKIPSVPGTPPSVPPPDEDEYVVFYHGNAAPNRAEFSLFCVPRGSNAISFDTTIKTAESPLPLLARVDGLSKAGQGFTFNFSHLTPDEKNVTTKGRFTVDVTGTLRGRLGDLEEYELLGQKVENTGACQVTPPRTLERTLKSLLN